MLNIPTRQPGVMSGSEFGNYIIKNANQATQHRDDLIFQEFVNGNIPSWLFNNLVQIKVSNGTNEIIYKTIPDILSIGSDEDFLRIPLMPRTARKIADLYGCSLITPEMSRQIFSAADLKLLPQPKGPPYDNSMGFSENYVWHNNKIEGQRGFRDFKLLVSVKKDIVFSKQLITNKNNVGIFGWFQPNGIPIQGPGPNCSSHNINYVDYSHGVRLVDRMVEINGNQADLFDVFENPNLCSLVSNEGSFSVRQIYI